MPVTVHRLLMERKQIALLAALASLVVPAVASAAQGEQQAPRERLRADTPAAASSGIGNAVALGGPLLDPVDRYSQLIAVTAQRTVHRQKVHARKRREAREEEKFAQLPGGVSMATLEAIAACESGGNPEAVSPEGTYRGKYQFDQGTWESVGGHGDPAQASEAEQDYRAALLYARSGSSPWPVCG
ncbi:MAG: transglycosylase family protein [Actinobacteria bacterium]|nr:transglycosylase family protein [Actinomycetota bacterium]